MSTTSGCTVIDAGHGGKAMTAHLALMGCRVSVFDHRTDYWRRGRTLERRGIDRLSVGELTQFVNDGLRCWEERHGCHCGHCAHGRAIN